MAVFTGYGYGATHKQCQFSASKALVDKLHSLGLLTDTYYGAIAQIYEKPPLKSEWAVMRKRLKEFSVLVNTPGTLARLSTFASLCNFPNAYKFRVLRKGPVVACRHESNETGSSARDCGHC